MTDSKHLSDFEGEIGHYDRLEEEITLLPHQLAIGQTILLSTGMRYLLLVLTYSLFLRSFQNVINC